MTSVSRGVWAAAAERVGGRLAVWFWLSATDLQGLRSPFPVGTRCAVAAWVSSRVFADSGQEREGGACCGCECVWLAFEEIMPKNRI